MSRNVQPEPRPTRFAVLADIQVGSSRKKQELYRGNYQLKVECGHSSLAAAQPIIQDMSKHVNVDCQKIGSVEQKVETQDGTVSNKIHVNSIDTFNQTINMPVGTIYNRDDIQIDYCPTPVREFTGRQNELEELKKMFEVHQVIAVVGMGGVGKSQLARKYAQQYKNTYEYRFWIEAATIEKLDSSFQELADKLDVKAISKNVLVNDVYKAFTKGRALLIFDNVGNPEHVYEYLPTRFQLTDVTANILITSIWTDWTTIREVSMILHPFESEVSLHLLQILIENESVQTDEENWMELANAMGHLPLALRLSSSFIRKQQKYNSKFTIQDYITNFNTRIDKLLTKTTLDYGNDRSIYVTTIMTLKFLGKNSKKLVNAAAYFNPEKILNSDLVPLIPKAYDLAEALADVINYSLFHDEGTYRFSMHRLIQTSIQLYQQKKKKDKKYYSLTLEHALQNSYSNQCDSVFAYANQYTKIIVQNYKREKYDRSVILKYLLRNRCIDVLKIIFETFKDDIDKYDAIYLAIESEYPDMFVFILSYVAIDHDLVFELFDKACEKDKKSIVQFLLGNRLISVTELHDDNQTLLHRAASHASSPIVSLILQLNKDVIDIQDKWGYTALHTVIELYNRKPKSQIIETVRILIDNGESVFIRDGDGCTALHYATLYKVVELVSLISQSDNTVVNIVDNNGCTALHRLCCYDYTYRSEERVIDIARVLIKNGASVVTRDSVGRTALHIAASYALAQMVSLLIQSNKEAIDMVDNRRNTALHLVASNNREENTDCVEQTISILIKNGLSIDTLNSNGLTLVDIIPMQYEEVLRTLADEHEKSTRSSNNGTM